MSTLIKLRRSAVSGRIPTTTQLELGELAINTADGKIFIKQYDAVSNTESIVEFSANPSDLLELLKTVDGANSGLDSDTLDGQEGTYYLDFTNFTNLPDPSIDISLSGKVTGSGFTTLTDLANGSITIVTELANTGVIAGSYGTSSLIPVLTIDEDGRVTSANTISVAGVSSTSWYSANNTYSIETVDGGVFNTVIDSFSDIVVDDLTANTIITQSDLTVNGNISAEDITANSVTLVDLSADVITTNDLTVNGNIVVTGTVDGRDVSDDGLKLDTIETNAQVNPSNTEILNSLLTVDGIGSNLDADLLDGEQGSYYLDYNNFTNVPASTLDLTLEGKVTGTAFSNTGIMTLITELANTGVTAGTYGSSSLIPILTIDEDGRITEANTAAVAGVVDTNWYSSNNTFSIETGDGGVFNTVIGSFSSISTGSIGVTGNITVTGNVDGRDVSVDGEKLDTIETGAQVNLSNTELLEAIKTVDGADSGLDADTLDGLHASEISAGAANTAIAAIGSGTITITAESGLTGSGSFTVNDFGNTSITIEHTDTSSQESSNNANGFVIQDITLDTYGHVTGLDSIDLDERYYTQTELDAGQLDNRYYTETEINTLLDDKVDNTVNILAGDGLTGGGALTANVTISHADTSNQANTSFDINEFITDLNLDQFGHVISATKETRNFLTLEDADERYVNITGDTMTGNLVVQGTISQDHASYTTDIATTETTSSTEIWNFDSTIFNSAEVIIAATQGINRHITKLLIVHNDTTAFATEFGTIATNTNLATYEVSLSGGNVILTATPSNGTLIEYKIVSTLIIN